MDSGGGRENDLQNSDCDLEDFFRVCFIRGERRAYLLIDLFSSSVNLVIVNLRGLLIDDDILVLKLSKLV